jgi:hypothetical protein
LLRPGDTWARRKSAFAHPAYSLFEERIRRAEAARRIEALKREIELADSF